MAKQMADRRKVAVALLALAVIVAVGGVSSYAAKYAHRETGEQSTVSEEFYFTSDRLTSDGKASYDLPAGTTSASFELRGYADDLRQGKSPVQFTYSVDGAAPVSGTVPAGGSKTVELTGLTAGSHTVTATSTAPYAQTLSATFNIAAEDDGIAPSVEDSSGSAYARLIVSTKEYEGNVTVSWPAGVIPDQAQDEFKDVSGSGGGSITKAVDKYSSYAFRFFKTDASQDYSGAGTITASK